MYFARCLRSFASWIRISKRLADSIPRQNALKLLFVQFHQPCARPIWIYSRGKNQILELSTLGATAVADFTLKSPDVLQVSALDCEQAKKGEPASRTTVISLHDLGTNGRLPNPPCPARYIYLTLCHNTDTV